MAIPPVIKRVAGNIACDWKLVISAGSLQSGRVNLREALSSTFVSVKKQPRITRNRD
jgi:hypothetical protein